MRRFPRPDMRRVVIVVPSLFTLFNLFFGIWAMVLASRGEFYRASWYIFFAGILDALDGRVARLSKTGTRFGAELDSLVDVVSFGVAPAFLISARVRRRGSGGVDLLLLLRDGGGDPPGPVQHHAGGPCQALLHRVAVPGRGHDARDVLPLHHDGAVPAGVPLPAAASSDAALDDPADDSDGEQRPLRHAAARRLPLAARPLGTRDHPVYRDLRGARARRVLLPPGSRVHGLRRAAGDDARLLLRGRRRRGGRDRRADRDQQRRTGGRGVRPPPKSARGVAPHGGQR